MILKKTAISVLCAAFALASAPVSARAGTPPVSSIVIDAASGEVISAVNADERRYPASLTKLMTLYIAFDALDKGIVHFNDRLAVSRRAAGMAPSKLGLKAGETISVEAAVRALIVKSANDCAVVLAEGLGYSEENFARTMTKVARELGMKDTEFRNASGLPHKEQKTTARDMALLGAAVYHHFPQYYPMFSMKEFVYKGQVFRTHNRLLGKFEGADGMKTGFTAAAGYNIVTSAERDGARVIAVTMGHRQLAGRDKAAAAMMDKGLARLAGSESVFRLASAEHGGRLDNAMSLDVADNAAEAAFGVQVGAFSNYSKARAYALKVRDEIKPRLAGKEVDVEAAESNSAVVYRSKIVAFDEKDAKAVCAHLQKKNKSCIVVAVNNKQPQVVARNDSRYDRFKDSPHHRHQQ